MRPNIFVSSIVRLVNGTHAEGVVQIHRHGDWQLVCVDRWTTENSQVLCRKLGFQDGRGIPGSAYGKTGLPNNVASVTCTGSEDTLDECAVVDSGATCTNYASTYCSGQPIDDSREF